MKKFVLISSALLAYSLQAMEGYKTMSDAIMAKDNVGVIKALNSGIQVDIKNPSNKSHETPLIAAIWLTRPALVKLLLDRGASVGLTDSFGISPLGWAFDIYRTKMKPEEIAEAKEIIKTLVAHIQAKKPEVINQKDYEHHSYPIHAAVLTGDPEIIELLIKAGADVKKTDSEGKTALDWAKSIPAKQATNRAAIVSLLEAASTNAQ